MPYNTKKILRDSERNPIPQVFNPVTDTFEPLTKKEFYGNSTDTKPINNIEKGSTFYEFDTEIAYIFNGTTWQVL